MSSLSSSHKQMVISAGALALGMVLIIGCLPYAAGYGDYRKTLATILTDRWFDGHDTTWQYGALVPFAVGWLIWRKQLLLGSLPTESAAAGLPIVALAMFSYFVGYKANNYYFGFVGVQMFVAGAILWLWGWAWLRQLAFPWVILGMMWPLVFLEDRLGFPLRLISVRGIEWMCQTINAPIVAQGTALISASAGEEPGSWMRLQVEGPCSGMNSLFALMFIAALFSHHFQPTFFRRVLLFALSIPLALLGNMVRLLLLILGCRFLGQDLAVGNDQNEMSAYHMVAGLMVFVVAFLGLQSASAWMSRLWGNAPEDGAALSLGTEKAHASAS